MLVLENNSGLKGNIRINPKDLKMRTSQIHWIEDKRYNQNELPVRKGGSKKRLNKPLQLLSRKY